MADVIIKHNSGGSDSVRPDTINSGEDITFKADGAAFDITFDDPNSFSPVIDLIHINSGGLKKLTPANDVTSISFNYKCNVCKNVVGRPAKIIVGNIKPIPHQLDRIESKIDVLLSKVENIEQKINKFIKK